MRPPEHLTDELAEIWAEMSPQVESTIAAAGLESLCGQVARMRDARERIDEDGLVVADSRGNPVPHPAIAIEKTAQAEVRNWLLKFRRYG